MINWQDRKAREPSSGGAEYVSPGRKPWGGKTTIESRRDDTTFQPQSLRRLLKNLPSHPQRRHQYVHRISEKRWLITLYQVTKPGQRERGRNQEQADDPMKPYNNDG